MRYEILICAALLLLALFNLPMGYYTFLRICVSVVALSIIVNGIQNGLDHWTVIFGIIMILFNPIIPIYLRNKSIWAIFNFISAILFVIKSYEITVQSEKNGEGREGIHLAMVVICIWIGSGVIAWNIISPDSFLGTIVFLIIWSPLKRIGQTIGLFLVALLVNQPNT